MPEDRITIEILKEIASVLGKNLDKLIFIGGTAMMLYHREADQSPPLYTLDIDTLVTLPCDLREGIESMGFSEILSLDNTSSGKFMKELSKSGNRIKIELLLPKKGKGQDWGKIGSNLNAERLRYLDVMMDNCQKIDIGDSIVVKVPHPARYLIQKLLVYEKRGQREKEKDCAYFADLLNLFADDLQDLVKEIKDMESSFSIIPEKRKWITKALEKYRELFGDPGSDGVSYAVELLNEDPNRIYRRSQRFLSCF